MGDYRAPAALRIEFPAAAAELVQVRRQVRSWLARVGLVPERAADLLLAVDEACANAIEHGHHNDGRTIFLHARHEDELIHITVADQGTWITRDEVPGPTRGCRSSLRGRGVALMRASVPDTRIRTTGSGTVVEFTTAVPRSGLTALTSTSRAGPRPPDPWAPLFRGHREGGHAR